MKLQHSVVMWWRAVTREKLQMATGKPIRKSHVSDLNCCGTLSLTENYHDETARRH